MSDVFLPLQHTEGEAYLLSPAVPELPHDYAVRTELSYKWQIFSQKTYYKLLLSLKSNSIHSEITKTDHFPFTFTQFYA
jgi:hypothetical protein